MSQEESGQSPIMLPQPTSQEEGTALGLGSKKLRRRKEREEEISQQIAANMYLVFLYR